MTINPVGKLGVGDWDGTQWNGGGIFANGGAGGTTATNGGAGGNGGTILIQGTSAATSVVSALPISASGGAGGDSAQDVNGAYIGNGGDGGAAGSVTIQTAQGGQLSGAFGSIETLGGNGGAGSPSGNGGTGGSVTIASLDGTNGAGSVSIGALRPDTLYGGISVNTFGGSGAAAGADGSAHLVAGSGGIGQLTSDPGANVVSNVPLEIASTGTVNLGNTANDIPAVYGNVSGDLNLMNAPSIALGDAAQPSRTLNVSGDIKVGVQHSLAAPGTIMVAQPVTAGGNVTLQADFLDPLPTGSLASGNGAANFIAFLPLVDQEMNGGATASAFFTPNLRIGDATTTASILIGSSTSPTPIVFDTVGSFSIRTAGNVTQNAPITFSLANTGMHGVQVSAGDVQLTDPNNSFAVLAGSSGTNLVTSTPGAFNVVNSGGFTVGTVDGMAGVSGTPGGTGSLTAGAGSIDIASGLQTKGSWTLSAPAGVNNLAGSTIDINSSSLAMSGALTNAGTIQLDNDTAGATLSVGAGNHVNTGTIASVGTGAAANTINLNGAGALLDNQGTVNVSIPLQLNAGGGLALNAGTLNVAAGQTFTVGTGPVAWNGGGTTGTGTLVANGGLAIGTGAPKSLNGLAVNTTNVAVNGQLDFAAGTLDVAGNLNVNGGGVLNLNGGTLKQPAGAFSNQGTVNVNVLALVLDGGDGGLGGGTYNVASGAGLAFTAGTYTVGALNGAGVFSVEGTSTANVTNANFTGTGVLMGTGALNVLGTASVSTLTQTGGTLGGGNTGSLTVASYTLNNPSGTGTIASGTNGFANLSLTSPGDLTIKGFDVSATGNLNLDSTTSTLLIDGSTVSGGNVTLAGAWVRLASSSATPSQATSTGNMTLNAALVELNGANGLAKLAAAGTMTVNATAVDVLAGAAPASIDPTTLNLNVANTLTLAGGSGANAAATVTGGAVNVAASNVSLSGGSGNGASAGISATTGNLVVKANGNLDMTAGAGANSDAVLTAGNGTILVAALQCTGCTTLASDPYLSTTSDAGAYALNGVTFQLGGGGVKLDSSVTQANAVAGSGGSGTSNVSNQPTDNDDQSQTNGDANGNKGKNKKLPTCK